MDKDINPIGLYIHIPFCAGKCPYCDFYSVAASEEKIDQYTSAVVKSIQAWSTKINRSFDTLYFGGGTPSLIGAERLSKIIGTAFTAFGSSLNGGGKHPPYKQSVEIFDDSAPCSEVGRVLAPAAPLSFPEITVECNPSNVGAPDTEFDFEKLARAGVNRISLGLQSVVDSERAALGRKGVAEDTKRAVQKAKSVGITNISLDLMLGIPGQTTATLKKSIDFCAEAGITHVSAYMLKIEEGTPFAWQKEKLIQPEEDETCDFYLQAVRQLEESGFRQYEISNFAKKGFESRHNLKYWNCGEYLGIGPAAHSFIDGRRFYYERDLNSFVNGCEPVQDGEGGGFEEYAMLRLRLNEGLTERGTLERYGFGIPNSMRERAKIFEEQGLLVSSVKGICFTSKGFLLSNKIIGNLLDL